MLLEAVLDAVTTDGRLRQPLPVGGHPIEEDVVAVVDLLSKASEVAGTQRGRDLMTDRVHSRQRTGGRPEPIGPYAQLDAARTLADDEAVLWRRGLGETLRRTSDGLEVVLSTRRVRLPIRAEPVVAALRSAGPASAKDLGAGPDTLEVIRALLAEGLVLPVRRR
jgi:hypothetical protein